MRIIAGSARGITLQVAGAARPYLEKARAAIFNSVAPLLDGAVALDLYAGSGALGIEALSRGAARAVLVENNRGAAAAIKENLRRCQLETNAAVREIAVTDFLRGAVAKGEKYALIFIDPPFAVFTDDEPAPDAVCSAPIKKKRRAASDDFEELLVAGRRSPILKKVRAVADDFDEFADAPFVGRQSSATKKTNAAPKVHAAPEELAPLLAAAKALLTADGRIIFRQEIYAKRRRGADPLTEIAIGAGLTITRDKIYGRSRVVFFSGAEKGMMKINRIVNSE
jgi:16S rRNA G966 N2-methylase RsmD